MQLFYLRTKKHLLGSDEMEQDGPSWMVLG